MAFVPFYDTFQYLALAETRSITIAEGHPGLPADDYGFFELFCDEPDCDCRRVLFDVERVKRHYSIFRGTVDKGSPSLKPNAPSSRTKKPHRKP